MLLDMRMLLNIRGSNCNIERCYDMNEDIQKEVDLINSMIATAVEHGGDSGGPYCIHEKELMDVIYKWLEFKNILSRYTVRNTKIVEGGYILDDIPQIVKREV